MLNKQNRTSKRSKFILGATAAVMAMVVVGATFITPASAGQRESALIGGFVGGLVGGALAQQRPVYEEPVVYYQEEPRYSRPVHRASSHVERCYAAYRSYDESTDTYISYSGQVRRCNK